MPGAPTPIYGLTVPTNLGDNNAWGTELNTDLATLDTIIGRPRVVRATVPGTGIMDLAVSNFWELDVASPISLSFANVPAGTFASPISLLVKNGGVAAITWPASMKWLGPYNVTTVPPLFQVAGYNLIQMWSNDNGTTWYAAPVWNLGPVVQVRSSFIDLAMPTGSTIYAMPANDLLVVDDSLEIELWGQKAATALTLTVKVDGLQLMSLTTGVGLPGRIRLKLIYAAPSGAANAFFLFETVSGTVTDTGYTTLSSFDWGATHTFTVTASSSPFQMLQTVVRKIPNGQSL